MTNTEESGTAQFERALVRWRRSRAGCAACCARPDVGRPVCGPWARLVALYLVRVRHTSRRRRRGVLSTGESRDESNERARSVATQSDERMREANLTRCHRESGIAARDSKTRSGLSQPD